MPQYRILNDAPAAARQLEREIVRACRTGLEKGRMLRQHATTTADMAAHLDAVRTVFKNALPPETFDRAPIIPVPVSTFEYADFVVENVKFCSMPGWEVNASVYRPKAPGKYPGVVCPTGHSNKFGINYVGSAQTFAKNGYIAVSFCPPGCTGELSHCNDHFFDGAKGWLTNTWCQGHFVADALACLDYLQTRPDVDTAKGLAMTGVSGGGLTTMFCSALDERITFSAPVCCISNQEALHFQDLYSSCPEQHGTGYLGAGLDFPDILALTAPRRLFLVGGALDEVFDFNQALGVCEQLKPVYGLISNEADVDIFIQPDSGHAYTVTMATEVVRRMNRHFKNGEAPLAIDPSEILPLSFDELACHPSTDVNMYTINAGKSRAFAKMRKALDKAELSKSLSDLLKLDGMDFTYKNVTQDLHPPVRWVHSLADTVISHGDALQIPGLYVRRNDEVKRPAILWMDEAGKWNAVHRGKLLGGRAGFLKREPIENEQTVFSVDVSGMGELEMQHTAFDIASWNSIERIVSYLSFAHGRPVMAYRVRDALVALSYLRSRADVDADNITIGGSGIGALTALLAAAVAKVPVQHVLLHKMTPSYSEIVENRDAKWTESILIPSVLLHTDIPQIIETLGNVEILA